jgi:hypothetical protein
MPTEKRIRNLVPTDVVDRLLADHKTKCEELATAYRERDEARDKIEYWHAHYEAALFNWDQTLAQRDALAEALKAWQSDYGGCDGCYCDQIIRPGKCAKCLTELALATLSQPGTAEVPEIPA